MSPSTEHRGGVGVVELMKGLCGVTVNPRVRPYYLNQVVSDYTPIFKS